MNDEKRAELLMDHYKDTFSHLLYHWKMRNRVFIYTLFLITLIGIDIVSPGLLEQLFSGVVQKYIGDACVPALGFGIVDLIARFLLLCLVVQYYQRSIHVDRQYRYLDDVEEKLCKLMDGDYVTREGKAYLSRTGVPTPNQKDERPLFLRLVGPLYVYVFPFALSVLILLKIFEWDGPAQSRAVDVLSAICSVGIVLYSTVYVWWVGQKK